jgi:hypothetical protein
MVIVDYIKVVQNEGSIDDINIMNYITLAQAEIHSI